MSISNHLNKIKNAIYGKEVRGAIHDAIKQVYDDASVNHDNANMEVKLARGTHNTLNDRLDNVDEIQAQTNAQLSEVELYKGEFVSTKQLGAVADGVTDDSDVIQSIINSHPKVYVNDGIYLLNKTLNFPNDLEIEFGNNAIFKFKGGIDGVIINNNVNIKNLNIDFYDNKDSSKSAVVYNGKACIDKGINFNPHISGYIGHAFTFDISQQRDTPNPIMPPEYQYSSYVEFINIAHPRTNRMSDVIYVKKIPGVFTGWFNSNHIVDGIFVEPDTVGELSGATNVLSFQIQAGFIVDEAALTVSGEKNVVTILQQDIGNESKMSKILVLTKDSRLNVVTLPTQITNYQYMINDFGVKNIINGHGNNSNYNIFPTVDTGYDNTNMCGDQDNALANADLKGLLSSCSPEIYRNWQALRTNKWSSYFSANQNKELSYVFDLSNMETRFIRVLGVGFGGNTSCRYVRFDVELKNGNIFTKEFDGINSKQTYVSCDVYQFCYSNNNPIKMVKVTFNPKSAGSYDVHINSIFMSSDMDGKAYVRQGGDTVYGDMNFKGTSTFNYALIVGDNGKKYRIRIDNNGGLYTVVAN